MFIGMSLPSLSSGLLADRRPAKKKMIFVKQIFAGNAMPQAFISILFKEPNLHEVIMLPIRKDENSISSNNSGMG